MMIRLPVRLVAALLLPLALVGATQPARAPSAKVTVVAAQIVARLPHDPSAFTEGLLFDRGAFYESTGYEKRSFIRRIEPETGKVLQSVQLGGDVFGEGIVVWGNEILNVIWHGGMGERRTLKDFTRTGTFRYTGEGWGMTRDAHHIILSDGSPVLRFLDPATMKVVRRLPVTLGGQPVERLNELEYVKGTILANVWMTGAIVRIDPASGHVTEIIDLSVLVHDVGARDAEAVPNGIAYDAATDRLFFTGKYWPYIYQVALKPVQTPAQTPKAGS